MNSKISTGFKTTAWGIGDRFCRLGLAHNNRPLTNTYFGRKYTEAFMHPHTQMIFGIGLWFKWWPLLRRRQLHSNAQQNGSIPKGLWDYTCAAQKCKVFNHLHVTVKANITPHKALHFNGLFTLKTFNTAHVHVTVYKISFMFYMCCQKPKKLLSPCTYKSPFSLVSNTWYLVYQMGVTSKTYSIKLFKDLLLNCHTILFNKFNIQYFTSTYIIAQRSGL